MVIELGSGIRSDGACDDALSILRPPVPYNVVIRIDDRRDEETVTYMVEKAFGEGVEMTSRPGGRISDRLWLEIGSFPREIAEARAEAVRRGAVLGGLGVGVLIKRAH